VVELEGLVLMALMVDVVDVVGAQVVEAQVILLSRPWDWPGWMALAAQVPQAKFVAEECRAEAGNHAGQTW
jgi:hypothetical protein